MTSSRKLYPTPATVTYYIGDTLIDDVFRVDFQRNISHQPVYGYDSKQFDFIAKGKELVTGNIIINYRYPGYLLKAVKYATTATDTNKFIKKPDPVQYDPVFYQTLPPASKLKLAGSLSGHLIKKLKEDLKKLYDGNTVEEDHDDFKSILDNDLYKFDLIVQYGYDGVLSKYTRTFKDCVIIGEGHTVSASAGGGGDMSSSAQPILEVYSFFAKTITTQPTVKISGNNL